MTSEEQTGEDEVGGADSVRLDKWLWFARFFKSRTLATRFLEDGKARLRGSVAKSHARIRVGDVITFSLRGNVCIVAVRQLGTRRGPAAEARTLYEDLSPARPPKALEQPTPFERDPGAGRPTKAERRAIDRLRSEDS
jgi:ribosome-associated heat shock protein Hsp15